MRVAGPVVAMIAVGLAPAGSHGAAASEPLRPTTPVSTVRCLAQAYQRRSLAEYGALLAADYRFHVGSAKIFVLGPFVAGVTREEELRSAAGLFEGVKRNGHLVLPPAADITATLDGFLQAPDPEHRDSTEHYQVVSVQRFTLGIRLAAGDTMVTTPSLHVFHLVRGDAAVRVEGQPADPGRWYLRRWLEDMDGLGLTLAIAARDSGCGERAPRPASPAPRSEGGAPSAVPAPVALAILPLGNPACPTLEVSCDLPGPEPARIEVFDVTGRLRNRRQVEHTGPGTVRVEAGAGARLAPGVYWVRLTQAARTPATRMVVVTP